MNEMNPKLKALIAAGLIGTVGLGMQSCSMPASDTTVEYEIPGWEKLGISKEDFNRLKDTKACKVLGAQDLDVGYLQEGFNLFIYKEDVNGHFIQIQSVDGLSGISGIVCENKDSKYAYFIPFDKVSTFYEAGITCLKRFVN